MGAGRKLGGMVSNQVNGANHVHAVAIQGLFNAHAQQQSHEQHLKSIKAAQKISGGQGFTVKTGEHSLSVGKNRGGAVDGGDHKPNGERTPPKEDHYENGRRFADGMHDRMRDIRDSAQGAGAIGEKTNQVRGEIEKGRLAITAKPVGSIRPVTPMREGGADRVTPGANVERVNGAIPIENKGGNPVKDTSRSTPGMGMVDRTNAGKVNNRLNRFEEKHLAERRAAAAPEPDQAQTAREQGW
jgi:hypothetical protein